jgi:hypothetical protein
MAALVKGAYRAGKDNHIDPTLILAVMAVESSFNPFAQSSAGAQGLMQVMTRVHVDKYDGYGGQLAAFDPLSNLRVGVWILRDCIERFGGVDAGLRCYNGATQFKTDGGYVNKVRAERERLQTVVNSNHRPSGLITASTGSNSESTPDADSSSVRPAKLSSAQSTSTSNATDNANKPPKPSKIGKLTKPDPMMIASAKFSE